MGFHCQECGCFITTETQKEHNCLRCTKRKGPCAEPYVREKEITKQIKGELKSVSLPPALANRLILIAEKERVALAQAGESARQGANRFEPELELYREAVHVGELAERGKAEENREKLKKIGSNFRIGRRRLSVEFKKPWELLLNFNSARAEKNFFSAEFFKSQKVRSLQDKVRHYFASHPADSL